MARKIIFLLLILFVLHCIHPPATHAQDNNPCIPKFMVWWWPDPIPFGWSVFGEYPSPFEFMIQAPGRYCPPSGAGGETDPPCPCASRPISLQTGNTYISQNDVSLPGLGGGLTLTRKWNSLWPQTQIASSIGMFGPNWRSTYEERLFSGGDNYVKYSRGDGTYWSFGVDSNGDWVLAAPQDTSASLLPTALGLAITFQNGEKRIFNGNTGLLTSISDRNGNTTQLTYDSSKRLTTVTDPASRHLYFNYGTGSQSLLVTSVTSDFGVTLSYAYDAQGRLSQVTKPDLTTVNFTYSSQSQITSVTDSNGKVLESHTYDSNGRGLTGSRANGVEAVTITYPQ